MKPRKIALTGAHGTGKTTLLNALSRHLKSRQIDCAVVPEVPRLVCSSVNDPEFFRRGNNTLEKQLTLLVGQPVMESLSLVKSNLVLCDRTIIDHWAYTRLLFANDLQESGLEPALAAFVNSHCSTYDSIFFLPIEFASIDDGTREADEEFQSAVSKTIQHLIELAGLRTYELRGTVEQRLIELLKTTGLH